MIGFTVYFCDVVIVRSAITLGAVQLKKDSNVSTWPQLALRIVVVACTAILLAFSLVPQLITTDLNNLLQTRQIKGILNSSSVQKYEADRLRVADEIYRLEMLSHCTNYAFSGGKKASEFSSPPLRDEAYTRLRSFTRPADSDSLKPALLPVMTTGSADARAEKANPCKEFLRSEEPFCAAHQASPTVCPVAYRLSETLIKKAAAAFGETEALSRYNPNRFDLRDLRRFSSGGQVPESASTVGKLRAVEVLISDALVEASRLTIQLKPVVPATGPASQGNTGFLEKTVVSFFSPVPEIDTPMGHRLDVNEVAGVMVQKLVSIGENVGFIVPIAVVFILAVFELLVVLFKSSGIVNVMERQTRKLDDEYEVFLANGAMTTPSVSESESLMKSDWALQDHFHSITSRLSKLLDAVVQAQYQALLVAMALLAVVAYLAFDSIVGNAVFRLMDAVTNASKVIYPR